MTVLTLAERAAQARPGVVPCRTYDSELWFSEDEAESMRAQQFCQTCPLKAVCLAEAIERKEPWGVWGGELFEKGRVLAQRKPKGRPRKDADEIAARAEQELAQRLAEVAGILDPEVLDEAILQPKPPAGGDRINQVREPESGAA